MWKGHGASMLSQRALLSKHLHVVITNPKALPTPILLNFMESSLHRHE